MYKGDDPLLPWIRCLKWVKATINDNGSSVYRNLLELCTQTFSSVPRYLSDARFVQIWIQFADCCHADAERIFKRMEALKIGENSALYYGAYSIYLEAQGSVTKAYSIYQLGLSRQANPIGMLNEAYKGFLKRISRHHRSALMKEISSFVNTGNSPLRCISSSMVQGDLQPVHVFGTSLPLQDLTNALKCIDKSQVAASVKDKNENGSFSSAEQVNAFCDDGLLMSAVNPWDSETINKLLSNLKPPLVQYKGFYMHKQNHKGASLVSIKCAPHNKMLVLGSKRYHLKGCTGQGAFAQVFKACEEQDRENIVVLKIQRPPCPWEFYIYSQLNKRIPEEERSSFGRAWKMHMYDDCSIMVCAYGERGTLQDVVNSYLATGQKMDELLCMYYTIEMLRMLEVLHSIGIIHGDFKPDNLLIRNEGEIMEDWGPDRPGYWKHQGLCLIDWGRSIDLSLFPPGTMLEGDCKTSGFQCIEMQQKKPWTLQTDTYGLCCIVHIMLHGSYMEIERDAKMQMFRPKVPLKRYQRRELWGELFGRFLNVQSCLENPSLSEIRELFENYLTSNMQFPKKIRELMIRQSKIMCSQS
ncbi:hypothetical protein KP509_22G033700 [Ceratopteris richardii]|nr:hypothetical protein KP509_22G033700 [Ceratopteris richardii]